MKSLLATSFCRVWAQIANSLQLTVQLSDAGKPLSLGQRGAVRK
jgi:hypothetical protein